MQEKQLIHFSIIDEARGVPVNGRTFGASIIKPSTFLEVSGVPTDACGTCALRTGMLYGPGGRKAAYVRCSQDINFASAKDDKRFLEAEVQPSDYQIAVQISASSGTRSHYVQVFANTAVCADAANSNIAEVLDHFRR